MMPQIFGKSTGRRRGKKRRKGKGREGVDGRRRRRGRRWSRNEWWKTAKHGQPVCPTPGTGRSGMNTFYFAGRLHGYFHCLLLQLLSTFLFLLADWLPQVTPDYHMLLQNLGLPNLCVCLLTPPFSSSSVWDLVPVLPSSATDLAFHFCSSERLGVRIWWFVSD